MDLDGQNLGQYHIIEAIGAGGMATVYKAYQPGLDRYVAIKVLSPQIAQVPGFQERFYREARAPAFPPGGSARAVFRPTWPTRIFFGGADYLARLSLGRGRASSHKVWGRRS